MTSDKVYSPETIADQPLPTIQSSVIPATPVGTPNTVYSPETVTPQKFPERLIAIATIGTRINTQSGQILGNFEFAELGALSIGKYENGVSGDIRLSPNGIIARNVNGDTTFTIDGTTGDATFKGTLQAGTLIAGAMNVGDPNVVIDGVNGRITIHDGSHYRVLIGKQVGGF